MVFILSQNTGSETNIKLPFSFILFGLVAFIASQGILLFYGDFIIEGSFRIPAIWSATHLFILGWAVMTAMGAMYQLVPVAFLTSIWSEKLGFFQFAVTAIGILSFAHALFHAPQTAIIPAGITLFGILLFLFQMVMTLSKQARPNILTLFVGSSLVCFFLTIVLGMLLVLCLKTGVFSTYYQAIFKTHLLLGLTGWFTLLIFGFSYKMVPMFSLSHGYTMKAANWVFTSYIFGLIIITASFFANVKLLQSIGLWLLFIGFSMFTYHMALILGKRIKKKLDRSFMFSLLAILFGWLIHLGSVLADLFGVFPKFVAPLLFSYLYFWIAFSIIGYLYKIVPFLWWTHKYSKEIGKTDVPLLKDMINDKLALPLFIIFISGILVVVISILGHIQLLFYFGQIIFLIGVLIFSASIMLVLRK